MNKVFTKDICMIRHIHNVIPLMFILSTTSCLLSCAELTTEDQKWIDYKEKEGLLRNELTTEFLVLMRGYPEAKGSVCKQAFHAALHHVYPGLKHK